MQVKTTGTSLTTILTIANIASDPPTPITGTADTYYYVAWQTGGVWWATLASEPQPDSMAFTYGNFNTSTNQLTTSNATTGTVTTGSPGTTSITVPLSVLATRRFQSPKPMRPARRAGTGRCRQQRGRCARDRSRVYPSRRSRAQPRLRLELVGMLRHMPR